MQRFAAMVLCVAFAGQAHAQTAGTPGPVRTPATVGVTPASPVAPSQPPSQAPPRVNGRIFTSPVVDATGVHQLQIRIKDGDAVTTVDGRVVPKQQVRLLKGGKLQILEPDGRVRFSVQLPRGGTRVGDGVRGSAPSTPSAPSAPPAPSAGSASPTTTHSSTSASRPPAAPPAPPA